MSASSGSAAPGARAVWPFALALTIVVVGLVVVVLITVLSPRNATQQVALHFHAPTPAQGWTAANAGVLVSTPDGHTRLAVQITRRTDGADRPLLRADFDGSGGGDAQPVACTSPGSTVWAVDVGETQEFDLPCDRFVPERALRTVASVNVAEQG